MNIYLVELSEDVGFMLPQTSFVITAENEDNAVTIVCNGYKAILPIPESTPNPIGMFKTTLLGVATDIQTEKIVLAGRSIK